MLFIEVIPTVLQATDLGHTTGCTICRQDATKVHRDIKQFVKVDQYMTFGQRVPEDAGLSVTVSIRMRVAKHPRVGNFTGGVSPASTTVTAQKNSHRAPASSKTSIWSSSAALASTLFRGQNSSDLMRKIQFLLGQLNKVNKDHSKKRKSGNYENTPNKYHLECCPGFFLRPTS